MGDERSAHGDSDIAMEIKDPQLKIEPSHSPGSDLLACCQDLVNELELFEEYLIDKKKENKVELRIFKNSVTTETKTLKRLLNADIASPQTAHTIRSSNFPFYSAVWDAAKRSTGVIAIGKRFYWNPDNDAKQDITKNCPMARHKKHSALVDIVAKNGAEWIKVSTLTEKRILFDMAKAGWAADSSSDDDCNGSSKEEEDEAEGLLKQAENLCQASAAARIRYCHPEVRIVLPKIRQGNSKEVDQLIDQIKSLGVTVQTSEDLQSPPRLAEVLGIISADPFTEFSDRLNIDCTILLAFVSDLSHSHVDPKDWHHRAILRQIELEKSNPLVANSLWPACGPREMVCTREAANRMQEIVDLIGTDSEKQRAQLLLKWDTCGISQEECVRKFQMLSAYAVPLDWCLPITVVDVDLPKIKEQLPHISTGVIKQLSVINESVFLFGWATGMTTISSNRTVAKAIESVIESNRQDECEKGPDIWLCPTARSLVGKEKTRRN